MKKIVPVIKNEYYEMYIDSLGHEGEGVGRIEGFTVFVPYALIGEKVKVKILKVKSSYAYGKLIEIIEDSKSRVKPICENFYRCGGCHLQHMNYKSQLEMKTQNVIDNLKRIGKIENVKVNDTIGMKNPFEYRNKAQFPVGYSDKNKEIAIGFYASRSHSIIPVDCCNINHDISNKIKNVIKKWMSDNNVEPYNEFTGKGIIRHIFTRVGFKTGEIMVAIITNTRHIPYKDKLIDAIRSIDGKVVSIIQNINTKRTNVIMGKENKTLWGKDRITDYIGDIKFSISPMSFYQVNPVQTEVLYKKALEYADLNGSEMVLDLYCGIGTISLFLAKKARKVIGIEIVEDAVKDARKNAKINGIENVQFYGGAAERVAVRVMEEQRGRPDVVVVDPPRKGCDVKLLDTIVDMNVKKVVYVSCNPSTLARDLRYLEDRGYKTIEVQPVDMFPQTYHVESVCLLTRKIKGSRD